MAAIVSSSTDAILSKTLDGTITSWNAESERLFGYTAPEVIGRPINLLIPEQLWGEEREILARISAGERVDNYETVRLAKDGRPVECAVSISPIREPGGAMIGASSIIRDISARKNAERSAAFLAAIVASMTDGVVSKTLEGVVTSWNKAAESIFGFTESEMVNQSIRRIIPPERQSEEDDILRRVLDGGLIDNFETVRLRKDGSLIEVSITVSPIRDGRDRIIGASKIVRDITERRQTERQLRELLREVNHRSKNMLALVQAIARQMTRSGQLGLRLFLERLQALSRSHDLLVSNEWRFIDLRELARSQLDAFGALVDERITVQGPPIELRPEAAQPLGMALHELTTNSAKYGALSAGTGRVDIDWQTNGTDFSISWTESDGPSIAKPRRSGFGTLVISEMIERSLEGKVELSYPKSGLSWRLTCPVQKVTSKSNGPGTQP